jgi:cyclomaltodextrinase
LNRDSSEIVCPDCKSEITAEDFLKANMFHGFRRSRSIAATSLFSMAMLLFARLAIATSDPVKQTTSTAIADVHARQTHLFRYLPTNGRVPKQVHLAGDFNGWSSTATPMPRVGDAFEASLTLSEGVHYYKFVADDQWLNDPQSNADLEVSDDHGGKNSAVLIGLDARTLPAPAPDRIDTAAVCYDASDVRDFNIASTELLRISIRAQAGDVAIASVLIQSPKGWSETLLARIETQMGLDRFGAVVSSPVSAGMPLRYLFKLAKPGATVYVAGGRAFSDQRTAEASAYQSIMRPAFETPDWAKHAIWYQIFPERFRNGDPSNDPPNTQKWTSKWFDKHPGETGQFYKDVWARRYGGDIQGIRQELPYLRSLGINAIYLNPIFQAVDLHKYDTTDYRHVDEHFGVKGDIEQLQGETDDPATWKWTASDKVFLDFLADAHRQGFKVIIDGVFNHVGVKFWAFQDVIKNGKNSKYADWFDITDWTPSENAPFHYHAWDKDNGALPALKKDPKLGIAHGPREHIMAITRRWLAPDGDPSRGVDGFRLDAPEGIAHPFWAEWRQLVKSIKPDAYISGEIWSWAQSYLQGDQYDAVMNYQFAIASQQFFVNQKTAISCQQLSNRADQLIFNYPFQVALVNQNLFDSHDTDRVASMFVNPDLPYDGADRIQDNGPHYNPAKPNAQQRQRMLQEVAWQMTFVGAPMIYYGDEAGMWSPDDPSDRQPMIWKDLQPYDDPQVTFDQGKFDWYQRLIAIRSSLPALQTGFFRVIRADDARGIFVFARELGNQHVYVALNHSQRPQTIEFTPNETASQFVDWLEPAESTLLEVNDSGVQRPQIAVKHGAARHDLAGRILKLELPAWGAMVVTSVQ